MNRAYIYFLFSAFVAFSAPIAQAQEDIDYFINPNPRLARFIKAGGISKYYSLQKDYLDSLEWVIYKNKVAYEKRLAPYSINREGVWMGIQLYRRSSNHVVIQRTGNSKAPSP